MVVSFIAFSLVGCAASANVPVAPGDAARVLVVVNKNSEVSREIGKYYLQKRGIPGDHMVLVTAPDKEQIMPEDYRGGIEAPVKAKVKALGGIDFIVLTKGVPLRMVNGAGFSVDSALASMDKPLTDEELGVPEKQMPKTQNPYFGKSEPFSAKKFGFYLVTRLDGYTVADAKALVDRALAAKPDKGPFFFDAQAIGKSNSGYYAMNETLKAAGATMKSKGFDAILDEQPDYQTPPAGLMGYATWGSNDGKFSLDTYHKVSFKPGALCETFVSTSGRTFNPTTGGQSLIADLIAQGVTGVKGYVSEPYTVALARPEILFDRYTSGFNLAESFYMASPLLKWKDIVVGDPLCAPYKK